MIKLIVGLGNPGAEYTATRHNAGFWFVDQLARDAGASLRDERRFHGHYGRGRLNGQEIHLLEPQTFMNRSGQSVVAVAQFFKILPDEILVAHDELDLPPGTVKLKLGGGSGGHNGLKDIVLPKGVALVAHLDAENPVIASATVPAAVVSDEAASGGAAAPSAGDKPAA